CVATPDIGPELGDARKGRPSIMVVQPRQAVWVSTTADVRWNAPPSDMISVEESVGEIQPWNDGNTASEIIRERFKKQLVPEAEKHLFGLFGHGFLVTPVAEEAKYVIYSNKVKQHMVTDEATSHRLMVTETAEAGVFVNPSTPEWELNKWMEGLSKGLDTMDTKTVLEKVPQSKFPNAKPAPSKLMLDRSPDAKPVLIQPPRYPMATGKEIRKLRRNPKSNHLRGRLRDMQGNMVDSDQRAETLAECFAKVQWAVLFGQ
ncbi:unnamed protein product, partial [Symbiodinium microadriaticum]